MTGILAIHPLVLKIIGLTVPPSWRVRQIDSRLREIHILQGILVSESLNAIWQSLLVMSIKNERSFYFG
jgi:hypothetical protein